MAEDPGRPPAVLQGSVVERLISAKRAPVIPAWIRDDVTRRAAAKHAALHVRHLALFHGARMPKYAARTLAWSPRGLGRAVAGTAGWVLDAEGQPLRTAAVAANDPKTHLALAKLRDQRVHKRSIGAALAGAGLAGGTAAASAFLWPLAWAAIAAAAVIFLGYLGRPRYRPFLDVATSLPKAERLTLDIVTRALGALNIAQINAAIKDGKSIDYTNIPHRDGPGWRVDAALPYGVTAADVINKRDKLSSGLRRPLSCVWPEPAPEEHDGHLTLWVGDEALSKARQPAWPLLRAGQCDIFKPVPFGTDQRMRPVDLPLMYANLLIGSIPRRGKTVAMRDVLLAGALDPIVEERVFELKGTGDLDPLEKVAHHFGSGADDETRERCLASLRQVYEVELIRRAKVIKGLPKDLCPDSKVTPALARRKSLGLHPIVFAIDECFPAGTIVGGARINELRPGDAVPSWDEITGWPCESTVKKVFRSRPSSLVRVRFDDGGSVVCTPGHPFMTRAGWNAAGALTPLDSALSYTHEQFTSHEARRPGSGDMLGLQEGVRDHCVLPRAPATEDGPRVLHDGMPRCGSEAERGEVAHVRGGAGVAVAAHDGEQPHERPGGARAGVRQAPGDRPQAAGAGRQRAWPDRAAEALVGDAELGDRARGPDRLTPPRRPADALQAGYREPGPEGGRGDRRRLSLLDGPPGVRSAQGCVAGWRRVDRVEVLEPGSDGRYGGLCPDGHVYNLEVAGTHTYRVGDGIVAHNCQEAFSDPDQGAEFDRMATAVIKRGPALGIMLILGTQRPDAKSLPTGVTSNVSIRFCLQVMDQVANDMVLGTSSYKRGVNATLFTERDKGIGYLVGARETATVTKTYDIDGKAAERVCGRARALREAAGTLTGQAAGEEEPAAVSVSLLADVASVMGGEERVWSETICARLGELRPELYSGWNPTQLANSLSGYGIETSQVWSSGANRRGVAAADIAAALGERRAGASR